MMQTFAKEWTAAWNSHDLDRILSHYSDDVTVVSPIAKRITGNAEIVGKEALRAYFAKGLEVYLDLHFRLTGVFAGEESVVLCYENQAGVAAAEFMQFDSDGKVVNMRAHYAGF